MNPHEPSSQPEQIDWKKQALIDFEAWLYAQPDELPTNPDPQQEAGSDTDLLTLHGELAALRQEVRGLSRNAARLVSETEEADGGTKSELQELSQRMHQHTAALGKIGQSAGNPEQIKRDAVRPLLLELADMADAVQEVSERKTTFTWPALIPASIRRRVEASASNPAAVLRVKAEALLQRYHLRPLVTVGDMFDPTHMNAVNTSNTQTVSPGCVSAIIRQAYAVGNDALRTAEVVVEEELS